MWLKFKRLTRLKKWLIGKIRIFIYKNKEKL